jgi:hypothetical protein
MFTHAGHSDPAPGLPLQSAGIVPQPDTKDTMPC